MVHANENQNIKAALAHIIGDLLQSIGVIIGAIIICFKPTWEIIDPLLSILFTIIAFAVSVPVTIDIFKLLTDQAPEGLDIVKFERDLKNIQYVTEIHDLHVWNMTFGKPNMTCHITCERNSEYVLKRATIICRKVGIYHSTI